MVGIERVIDAIAAHLGYDPLEVRLRNLYGEAPRNVTPYHMTVEDNVLPQMLEELKASSGYIRRREEIERFNRSIKYPIRPAAMTAMIIVEVKSIKSFPL